MNVQPFYQRRKRWDAVRQSRLIESFVINIPVPPLFVYETEFNTYEVMDGQQSITAIQSFYANEFALKGLERWPELNGRRYSSVSRGRVSWKQTLSRFTNQFGHRTPT